MCSSRFSFVPAAAALIFLLVSASQAQNNVLYDAQAEELFNKAITAYDSKDFAAASELFDTVAKRKPVHQKSTAAYLMGARAHMKANNPEAAVSLLTPFFIRFPSSMYQGEAILLLGDAQTLCGKFADAFNSYAIGLTVAADKDQKDDFIRHFESMLVKARFKTGQFNTLIQRIEDDIARGEIAEMWERIGPAEEEPDLNIIRKAVKDTKKQTISMAIVLPGERRDEMRDEIVADIRSGIDAAIAFHAQTLGCSVDTIVYSMTSLDSLRKFIRQLAQDNSVMGVVGGVFSDDSRDLVKATAGTDLPLVLPTATADDLSAGSEVFQMNVPFSVRGKVLAEYVKNTMKAQTVAILAPLHSYARTIAESFKNHAQKIGLLVDVVSWYRPGTDEMARQFYSLKTRQFTDSIDVLFAPVENPADISLILKGVAESGFTHRVLGAGDWNHPDTIAAYAPAGVTVEFATEYAPDTIRSDYRQFASLYRSRFEREPSKHALFGYDAAAILLRSLCSNARKRSEVINDLSTPFNGMHSLISMSALRQNSALTVMRYANRSVKKVTTIQEETDEGNRQQ